MSEATIQRYRTYGWGPENDGEWVKHADHLSIVQAQQQEIAMLRKGCPCEEENAALQAQCDRMKGLLGEYRASVGVHRYCMVESDGCDNICDLCKRTDEEVGQ